MPKYNVLQPIDIEDTDAAIVAMATAEGITRFSFGLIVIERRLHWRWGMMFEGEEYAGAIAKEPEKVRDLRNRTTLLMQAFNAITAVQARANTGG